MKLKLKLFGLVPVTLALVLAFTACPTGNNGEVAPVEITWTATPSGNPTNAIVFDFDTVPTGLLSTDITITGGTGSATRGTLSGTGTTLTLSVTNVSDGTVYIAINRAGIAPGPQTVTLVAVFVPVFVPVTEITGVPAVATAGIPLALSGTVSPANATNSTISWSVWNAGATGATISGGTLYAIWAGTVTVRAMITDGLAPGTSFTMDFPITVNETFVPVAEITEVPAVATAGIPLVLSGTVSPANATNSTISWILWDEGATGATISDDTLHTAWAGTVTVRATITDGLAPGTSFTMDFPITVNDTFVPVTEITGVPAVATAGIPLVLSGTVIPANATNSTVSWSVWDAGTTGATISDDTLHTAWAGTVTVRATITDGLAPGTSFTMDFPITVNETFVPVTEITGVSAVATAGIPLALSGTVSPANATNSNISWSVWDAGATEATISDDTLHTTSAGTVMVRATVASGTSATIDFTQDFTLTVAPPPPGDGDFTIGFGLDIPMEIIGPTIRLGDNLENPPRITVLNPEQFDAESIRWFMGETQITGGAVWGDTLTLDPSAHNNRMGTHRITVEVRRGGALYSRVIVFTVTL